MLYQTAGWWLYNEQGSLLPRLNCPVFLKHGQLFSNIQERLGWQWSVGDEANTTVQIQLPGHGSYRVDCCRGCAVAVGWGRGVATGTGTLNSELPLTGDVWRFRLLSDSAISFSYTPAVCTERKVRQLATGLWQLLYKVLSAQHEEANII